jgi:hypothetical protein
VTTLELENHYLEQQILAQEKFNKVPVELFSLERTLILNLARYGTYRYDRTDQIMEIYLYKLIRLRLLNADLDTELD